MKKFDIEKEVNNVVSFISTIVPNDNSLIILPLTALWSLLKFTPLPVIVAFIVTSSALTRNILLKRKHIEIITNILYASLFIYILLSILVYLFYYNTLRNLFKFILINLYIIM